MPAVSDRVKRLLDRFSRATLRSAMAENSAVMMASGWRIDNKGDVVQDAVESEDTKRLAYNLAQIAFMPLTDVAAGAAGAAVAGTRAYKSYKLAKAINSAVKESRPVYQSAVSPVVSGAVSGIDDVSRAAFDPGFLYTLDDISKLPEPVGVGYSGYTPTVQSSAGKRFVDDVNEAVAMSRARGTARAPKSEVFDFTGDTWIGGGAESAVYKDTRDAGRVLKVQKNKGISKTVEEALEKGRQTVAQRNVYTYNMPLSLEGVAREPVYDGFVVYYPVVSQEKLGALPEVASSLQEAEALRKSIDTFANRLGTYPVYNWSSRYAPVNNMMFENADYFIRGKDFKPANIGFTKEGMLMGFDLRDGGPINKQGRISNDRHNRIKSASVRSLIEKYGKERLKAAFRKVHKYDGNTESSSQMERRDKTRVNSGIVGDALRDMIDWNAREWLELRAENDKGPKYTDEDIQIFESHIPEYQDIERKAKISGTWLDMPDGTKWRGDPREWVIMQSAAYKKNYSSTPWWTGQARYSTNNADVPSQTYVSRARYHNGNLWLSNNPDYARTFAEWIDAKKGQRKDISCYRRSLSSWYS